MAAILLRIFSLYNILNTILLCLVPKKLRAFLPPSWYPQTQQQLQTPQQLAPKPPPSRKFRRMDSNDLHRVFQMFDHDGDGQITKEELRDSFENMGIFVSSPNLTRMIEEIDADGDGCVDIAEFTELYGSIVEEEREEEDGKDDLVRGAFDVFDENGDGFITVDELRSVLASLGLKQGRAADDCRRMISMVDIDGDGRVNFHEFERMLQGGGFAALS